MTQARRDEAFKAVFGRRLTTLVCRLQLPWAEFGKRLGYKTDATVRQAGQGRTLLSAERLALLGTLVDSKGNRVSLDWLLTGSGTPFLSSPTKTDPLLALLAEAPPDAQDDVHAYLRVRTRAKLPASTEGGGTRLASDHRDANDPDHT